MTPQNLILYNARIYDGSGSPPFFGGFCVQDGRFSHIFRGSPPPHFHGQTLDAAGLSVAPGFIDAHAHSDLTLFPAPQAFSKISQGVTSEISGNCGHSLFPVTRHNYDHVRDQCRALGVSLSWRSFNEYSAALARRHPIIRTFFFCGHNTLAAAYPGNPAAQAVALQSALAQGALGLSTGLLYAPGRDAPLSHLLALMHVLRIQHALYVTHLRSEGDRLLPALREAISLARAADSRLHVSHLKTAGQANWHKLPALLDSIRAAQNSGLQITADRYPYVYSQTSLSVLLPSRYDSMRDAEIQHTLAADPDECARLVDELHSSPRIPDTILTASSIPRYSQFLGMSLRQAALSAHISPAELTVRILRDDAAAAMAAFPGMSAHNLASILDLPFVCCGTDENARPIDDSVGRGHPRSFGAFPLFIKHVAKHSSMAQAIRRVTSLPANIFRLTHIGAIKQDFHADFVIFDESSLDSQADFIHPHTPASGILAVYINGSPAFPR